MARHKYLTSPPNLTGMPPGVPYIIGNEAAERFSYYGMKSVLTVFMAHYILNQSGLLAPMQENEAYMYTHYFVFGVYFLPILGAILADGWIGQILDDSVAFDRLLPGQPHARVHGHDLWGIAIGQRTMLAIGLFLICLGAGGIKPCVSANVGDQFGESNKHLLSKMFGWFYLSINAGSFISSLCPWLLANPKYGARLGVWNSRHRNANRYFVFLGRSQENGARAAGRPWLFERNIQQRRSDHSRSGSRWFTFLFWFSGRFGE